MWRPVAPWAGFVALGVAWELRELRRGDSGATLSSFVRVVFWTRTRPGKIAFVAGWAALTTWFLPHILRDPPVETPPRP